MACNIDFADVKNILPEPWWFLPLLGIIMVISIFLYLEHRDKQRKQELKEKGLMDTEMSIAERIADAKMSLKRGKKSKDFKQAEIDNLREYVKKMKKKGRTNQQIKENLKLANWKDEVINEVIQ